MAVEVSGELMVKLVLPVTAVMTVPAGMPTPLISMPTIRPLVAVVVMTDWPAAPPEAVATESTSGWSRRRSDWTPGLAAAALLRSRPPALRLKAPVILLRPESCNMPVPVLVMAVAFAKLPEMLSGTEDQGAKATPLKAYGSTWMVAVEPPRST